MRKDGKAFYWGILDGRQSMPSHFYDRGRDAHVACNRLNHSAGRWPMTGELKGLPRFRVQRFVLVRRGSIVDVYQHEREQYEGIEHAKKVTRHKRKTA